MVQPGLSRIKIYYDGQCPICLKDRERFEKWDPLAKEIQWIDITKNTEELLTNGLDPNRLLVELHVRTKENQLLASIDAYVYLFNRIAGLKWLAKFIDLPVIKQICTYFYNRWVMKRLCKDGRWPVV